MVFEPLDFIARLAALVPKPRVHLTRFHGVFAPNSKFRTEVTSESKTKNNQSAAVAVQEEREERRSKMSWAMRLKRVFNIDITVCRHCQGMVKIIACIEARAVIDKILAHMKQQQQLVHVSSCIRAPPIERAIQLTINYE